MASGIAALAAAIQFVLRFRRAERVRARRRLLGSEVAKLQTLRHRIEDAADPAEAQALLREADDLLGQAEQDAAADLLDADAIQTLRSVHEGCWRAMQRRQATRLTRPAAAPQPPALKGTSTNPRGCDVDRAHAVDEIRPRYDDQELARRTSSDRR